MKQGLPRLSRKESEGRLVSAWLGATAVSLPAGIGMLCMALPVGLLGASLIGGWFTFASTLGLVTFGGLMMQAHERSPRDNFKPRHFFKGMAASAIVCGGILGTMAVPVREAFNQQARYHQSLNNWGSHSILGLVPDNKLEVSVPAVPVQKP